VLLPGVPWAHLLDQAADPHLDERDHAKEPHAYRGLLQVTHRDDTARRPKHPHEDSGRFRQPEHDIGQWSRVRDQVRVIEWPEVLPTRYLALIGSLGIADNAAFSADPTTSKSCLSMTRWTSTAEVEASKERSGSAMSRAAKPP